MMFGILLLVFLFYGEPDVWDNLHEYVMYKTSAEQYKCTKSGEK